MLKKAVSMVLFASLAAPVSAAPPPTEEGKTLYVVGMMISRQLGLFDLSPLEFEIVKQGLTDAFGGKSELDIAKYQGKVQKLLTERRDRHGETASAGDKAFLDRAAQAPGAVKMAGGAIFLPLRVGEGTAPELKDTVLVNFRGTLPKGEEFGNSYAKGAPVELKLEGCIRCWQEALPRMKTGGKAKLVCPPDTAYGNAGLGDRILPHATLVFEMELVGVKK